MGFVRYILAISVVIAHFNIIFGTDYSFIISSYDAVGGFFALSGFLLYGSFLRNNSIKNYIKNRARRIIPPYFFIVLSCAFLLVFVSTLDFKDYFFNIEWIKYLLSNLAFLNFLQPDLPGVFQSSPLPAVNGSLWTMKVEIMLYCSIPIVLFVANWIYVKVRPHKSLILFIFIYIVSLIYRITFLVLYESTEKEIYEILGRQFFGQLNYFYSGVFIYFAFFKIKRLIRYVFPIALVLYILRSYLPYYLVLSYQPFVTAILVLGLSFFKGRISVFNNNNVSYDIYLFHFPIIHLFFQYKDFFHVGNDIIFVLTCIAILVLSFFSWFIIEKPILSKNHDKKTKIAHL